MEGPFPKKFAKIFTETPLRLLVTGAFEQAWTLLKESGPQLNDFEMQPPEGYQDFRVAYDNPMAGNFPAVRYGNMEYPTGSNINLSSMATLGHSKDEEGNLTPQGEIDLGSNLARVGRHEAIHQATHPILESLGFKRGRLATPEQREAYSRATEYAANLLMHNDKDRAYEELRSNPVFENDEDIARIADRVAIR